MAAGKAVVAETIAEVGCSLAREERAAEEAQASLFVLPCDDATGRLGPAAELTRKAGRPPGAANRSTRQLREWLLNRGIFPQAALMQWAQLGPIGLAEALGCDKLDAFREWRAVMAELGRYIMPPLAATDDQGKAVPQIGVFIGGAQGLAGPNGQVRAPWDYLELTPAPEQENQALSAADDAQSKVSESKE